MMASIRAEFRKLLTIRSTYIIALLALGLIGLFAGYANGYKAAPEALQAPDYLSQQITMAVSVIAVLVSLIGLLLMTHEYRYNTIVYTLGASNSRTKTWLAKTVTLLLFGTVLTLVVACIAPLFSYIGLELKGMSLAPQTIDYLGVLWRILFYGCGYMLIALVIAAIIRSQVGAIAAFFLLPSTVEPLLSLLLKENSKYLPFASLNHIVEAGSSTGAVALSTSVLSAGAFIVITWLIAWFLLLRRDAN